MDKKAITESLRALASNNVNRSKAACLRDVIDDVEVALAAGVSRTSLVQTLAANGLEMSLATFETTLKRIRQKRAKPLIGATKAVAQAPELPTKRSETASVVNTENAPESSRIGIYDPRDLDRIQGSQLDFEALAKIGKELMRRQK